MKKKIIVLALIVTLLCSGCGSKIPTLSNGDEAVVTLKDGSMISVNELYNAVKSDYALETLVTLVDQKILEEKYADKVEEAKNYADNIMNQYESIYGEQFETLVRQNGYPSLEAFKNNNVYINYLRNLEIEDYCKKQVTEKEIKKYYDDEIVGDIKVNHILISPKTNDSMTDEEKSAADTEAKEKVEAIIAELKKTNKNEVADKFAELAKEQSEDESTKDNGGSLGFINKDTLSSDYDELVKAAYKLKDGEYSTSVITTEIGYHVILRSETKEKADIEEVRDTILEALGSEYLTDNLVANVKALQELRKEYETEIVDTDLQSKYATYIQNEITYWQNVQQQQNNQSTTN